MTEQQAQPPWVASHEAACAAGEAQYRDPETGYRVFTEVGLRQRGECCGCGCRHCPWAHEAVPAPLRAVRIARPAWLHGAPTPDRPLLLVFWSGGKDSFLAARSVRRHDPSVDLALVTTFGQKSRVVAHQELPIQTIVEQAQALGLPLLGVPLYPGADYTRAINDALRYAATGSPVEVESGASANERSASAPQLRGLVFGDLHLQHIRQWREEQLADIAGELGLELQFPLWQVDYAELWDDLQASGARARVCASPDFARIAPVGKGDLFDAALMSRLPEGVDKFGENGEFHTELMTDGLGPQHL